MTIRSSSGTHPIFSWRRQTPKDARTAPSFKGGMPGFVRVTGAAELAFPDYDGNGMFKSLGNALVNPNIGMLFIAMHGKPKRLRERPRGSARR